MAEAGTGSLHVRVAEARDLEAIREIYNQGIAERVATLDDEEKSEDAIRDWFDAHRGRYGVLVAERNGHVVGWVSLNRYSQRPAYRAVADLSVYVERNARRTGAGTALLRSVEDSARRNGFHKIVLFAIADNPGTGLYRKMRYRDVGVFKEQGRLDGRYVDVAAMEKIVS